MKKSIMTPMTTVFAFHGTGGKPEGNWFPWLRKQLEAKGYAVTAPAFPSPEHPNLETWMQHMQTYPIGADSVLIGHSLGATLVLRILETLTSPVIGSFLVAPVSEPMGNDFDPLVASFIDHPFDWDKIKKKGGKISLLSSDDDPYIPLSHARTLADHTGASMNVISGGGHLNSGAGFRSFPLLFESILTLLS